MEWGVIFATLAGPVLAVQAQKWIERAREQRNKQLQIFHILMATRAIRANATEHVQALNSIDLFFSKNKKKERPVVNAWSIYFDHLHNAPDQMTLEEVKRWNDEGGKLLVELLSRLSAYLGYDFDQVQLKRGVYFPRALSDEMEIQMAVRQSLLRVLQGEHAIKMAVTEFPPIK